MKICSPHANLGDNLWFTPLFKFLKSPIYFNHGEHIEKIVKLFDNITEVKYQNEPISIKFHSKEHKTKQLLDIFQIDYKDKNIIPFVILTEEEINWAKSFLEKYKNPIVIINDNSGSSCPENSRAKYVLPPRPFIQDIAKTLAKKHSVLQFGLAKNFYRNGYDNFTPLENATHIRGLSIRQLAACYHVIGKYIGGDTGDYHLMLAVGGRAEVFIPKESEQMGYLYKNLLYHKDMWGGEEEKVKYYQF